jgi:hypothetical protein
MILVQLQLMTSCDVCLIFNISWKVPFVVQLCLAMIGKNKGKPVVVVVVLIYHINNLHSIIQTVLDTYGMMVFLISTY